MNCSTPGLPVANSRSSPEPMSIVSVMPSNHLILCHPLLLLPSIFPSIRVFSNESALRIKWPKYWSFSFNISPSNEHQDWLVIREMQVKTRRTYHLIPTRVNGGVKNSDNSKCWRGCGERILTRFWWGQKMVQPLVLLGHVQLFVTLQTIAFQAPLSVEFSRHEYWSGLPWCSHFGIQPSRPSND